MMGERGLPRCKGIESSLLEDNLKKTKPKKTHTKKPPKHTTTPKQNKNKPKKNTTGIISFSSFS